MTDHRHRSFEELADLAEGRLSPDERETALVHVATCSVCAETLSWLEYVTTLMRSDETEDAPDDLIKQVNGLLQPKQVQASPGLGDRIRARLRFDSGLSPAFGIRSQHGAARQMLFETDELAIDLRIEPEDGLWIVSGQVLGPCSGGRVEVTGDTVREQATLNEMCVFRLPVVPPGTYTLIADVDGTTLEVPELTIGHER